MGSVGGVFSDLESLHQVQKPVCPQAFIRDHLKEQVHHWFIAAVEPWPALPDVAKLVLDVSMGDPEWVLFLLGAVRGIQPYESVR